MSDRPKPRKQYFQQFWGTAGDLEWLDDDHVIQRFYKPDGTFFGFNEQHWKKDHWCGGYVAFETHEVWTVSGHTLHGADPLHVEASLACGVSGCDSHGFIRDGKWVDA